MDYWFQSFGMKFDAEEAVLGKKDSDEDDDELTPAWCSLVIFSMNATVLSSPPWTSFFI